MRQSVIVTAQHGKRGLRDNPCHCPLALALREIPGVQMASIGHDVVYLQVGKGRDFIRRTFRLPAWVAKIVREYDKGKEFIPCEFELEEVEGSNSGTIPTPAARRAPDGRARRKARPA